MQPSICLQRQIRLFALILLIFLLWPAVGGAAEAGPFENTLAAAMKTLSVAKGDPDLLVMTDAPYVKVAGKEALPFLASTETLTGCSVGRGNLLFFQRPQSYPLRVMLFKKNGQAVIVSAAKGSWISEAVDLSPAAVSNPEFWKKTDQFKAGKDFFTMAGIANVWAKDGPYDFLKCAELHNHICPGLTSGYLMAHYILGKYPLKQNEKYTIVSSPVWCKEDALQVVLDATPGKRTMVVKPLAEEQLEKVAVRKRAAGMVLIWNKDEKTGKGVVLSFDFPKLRALSPKGTPKAATVIDVVAHLDKPEQFVTTAKEFPLTEALFSDLTRAGNNPYEVAGLVKE